MFWSTRKIIISTGHELHHPHYAHFYCYFSHRLGIERVKEYKVGHCARKHDHFERIVVLIIGEGRRSTSICPGLIINNFVNSPKIHILQKGGG